jgi:hypothetical protein
MKKNNQNKEFVGPELFLHRNLEKVENDEKQEER